ncbi:MAG: hypothetical protein K6G58_11005 [Lachnospiraceae bacterium]|nr:hypothetical protein [Lachnospiraceae bacterium]
MKRRNPARILIVFVVLAIGIVGLFFYISNRSRIVAEGRQQQMTPVQEVLARNLDTNYPPTPKEVLKFYSEITRCFYGEEYTDEELIRLATMSRRLFDDELVANQTDEQYLSALRMDIDSWKKDKKVISSYSVSSSTDVQEYSYGGFEWAQLYCIYSIRMGTNIAPIQEHFIMRKDSAGHWKILGWELVEPGDGDE